MLFDAVTYYILGFGCVFVLWYSMVFGYMYTLIANQDDFATYYNRWGMILGVGMLGCIALAIGMTMICAIWLDMDTTAVIGVAVATLAFGASVSGLAISSIIH